MRMTYVHSRGAITSPFELGELRLDQAEVAAGSLVLLGPVILQRREITEETHRTLVHCWAVSVEMLNN